ncbi:unnamed protein product [Vitrella brassicaformis CCMP3155]|uniref:3-beta hydroxysteroid dehydrogenase/isomerase domain-containing protein n=2 Tax=Vitrella brassicaformis TaxID=1169539 RepID=A0A0G4GYV8_VITBC|nr:unnamed protein product [Vitrella brassicaformis CCMP3155]|eukprot:CEM36125.1 unnamed protein product [Vitrella brassicaformis CCMP3155]
MPRHLCADEGMDGGQPSQLAEVAAGLQKEVVCVIGGCGYLGSHLVGMLHGVVREIRVYDVAPPTALLFEQMQMDEGRREKVSSSPPAKFSYVRGDILDMEALCRALEGCTSCIHCAAMIDVHGDMPASRVREVNVQGTRNVLEACERASIPHLVYTSTVEVINGLHQNVEMTEDAPYPPSLRHFLYKRYAQTKADAERLLRRHAQTSDGRRVRIIILRPVAFYGEGDKLHIGDLIHSIRRRIVTVLIGAPPGHPKHALMDFAYVKNICFGHLLALHALKQDDSNGRLDGEVFLLSDDTPAQSFFEFNRPFVEQAGYTLPSVYLPWWICYLFALLAELWALLVGRMFVPLTTIAVDALCYTQTIKWDKARHVLGYRPLYTVAEGMDRTLKWFAKHPECNSFGTSGGDQQQRGRGGGRVGRKKGL